MGQKKEKIFDCKKCFAQTFQGAKDCDITNCTKWRDWNSTKINTVSPLLFVKVRQFSFNAVYGS